MTINEARNLLRKYREGRCTAEERAIVDSWLISLDENAGWSWDQVPPEEKAAMGIQLKDRILGSIRTEGAVKKPAILSRWLRLSAAAALIPLLLAAGYFYLHGRRQHSGKDVPALAKNTVIEPGGNKATLILADGTTVSLNEARQGLLSRQGAAAITKVDSGRLRYDRAADPNAATVFNKITTPRGGQYQLQLSDGTKVWLNAASSLRFPTSFGKGPRQVALTGEAYFEVARSKDHPFLVAVNGARVDVLGTSFNINGYTDEPSMRTTLVEGSIRVSSRNGASMVKPGQEADVRSDSEVKLREGDVELALAWKNGFTSFKSGDLRSILRQVEKWYDVEIQFEGGVPTRTFTGDIARNAPLSELLKILEASDIHFKIRGRQIIVLP